MAGKSEKLFPYRNLFFLILPILLASLYVLLRLAGLTPSSSDFKDPSQYYQPTPTYSLPNSTPTAEPTPAYLTYTNDTDNFSVVYPSYRSLSEEKGQVDNRHVFYSPKGNITVHVGQDWSWIHPGRQFSSDLQISGKDTFKYEIISQSIYDFQNGSTLYTIQCVHNDKSDLRKECADFIASFRFLK